MIAVGVAPIEKLRFDAQLQRAGADPAAFKFWKFADDCGESVRVRVFGRGAAAVYDVDADENWVPQFARDLKNGRFAGDGMAVLDEAGLNVLRAVAAALAGQGIEAGLEILNQRVPHRFTGIYRLTGNVLHNAALVDKEEGSGTVVLTDVPLNDSFCQFVFRDGSFSTTHSGTDARLAGNPYSGIIGSYVGVPIPGLNGGLYGTLCHFDFGDHAIGDEEFLVLGRVAQILPRYLAD